MGTGTDGGSVDARPAGGGPAGWDMQADVVVVGFGAAGACAALEAVAAGCEVLEEADLAEGYILACQALALTPDVRITY